jgi:hypothetical protein
MFYQILFVANASVSHVASFLPLLAAARQRTFHPSTPLLSVAGKKDVSNKIVLNILYIKSNTDVEYILK